MRCAIVGVAVAAAAAAAGVAVAFVHFSLIEFFTLTTFSWRKAQLFTLLATKFPWPVRSLPFIIYLFIYFCADFMRLRCDFSAAFCA